ncbi:serine hydrolase domain-containing protein [Ornithinimicrobium cavernae]|uniref:serine hydrolase domain-containing protein n=1 Tax=Ornithinimicrobium cavernae TaxID=2666047 RepID=UPI000D6A0298|nr:serine hydrolase domain-containing protein [Ornithinimicrobium cavernae]
MALTGTDLDRVSAALDAALSPLVGALHPPGLSWAVDVAGDRRSGALGHLDAERTVPAETGTLYRISSMTKPVTAVAALALVDDGVLALDQPVDDLLPELAGPRVLLRPDGPVEETETARRPITVEDVLTFRLGHGLDFTALGRPNPLEDRLAQLGLAMGPPAPREHLPPDEWLARLGSVPLRHQPGERWLYNTGSEVLGVLVSRAAGVSFGDWVRQRVLDPLGMPDTGFSVPVASIPRFGACFTAGAPDAGHVGVYDPVEGQWSSPPPFEGGDGGLVSTVGDFLSFAVMLRDGGAGRDTRVLSERTVAAMTTNRLTERQLRAGGPSPDGRTGWGLGVGVALGPPSAGVVGSYGWDGGLGSSWRNDTERGLSAVLLTNQMWAAPVPPAVCETFWSVLAELVPALP